MQECLFHDGEPNSQLLEVGNYIGSSFLKSSATVKDYCVSASVVQHNHTHVYQEKTPIVFDETHRKKGVNRTAVLVCSLSELLPSFFDLFFVCSFYYFITAPPIFLLVFCSLDFFKKIIILMSC